MSVDKNDSTFGFITWMLCVIMFVFSLKTLNKLDEIKAQLDLPAPEPVCPAPIVAETPVEGLEALADRTECLRATMDTLIGVWPGRHAAPQLCGNWPAWKSFGESTDFGRVIK